MYWWAKDKFSESPNSLIFVGGNESNKWLDDGKSLSRNYKQGYRIYDSTGIACSLTASGGGIGGYTGLYTIKTSKGIASSKDSTIAVGAAMRGRYNLDGKVEQNIEIRNEEISNAITTVQKDSLVVIKYQ